MAIDPTAEKPVKNLPASIHLQHEMLGTREQARPPRTGPTNMLQSLHRAEAHSPAGKAAAAIGSTVHAAEKQHRHRHEHVHERRQHGPPVVPQQAAQ